MSIQNINRDSDLLSKARIYQFVTAKALTIKNILRQIANIKKNPWLLRTMLELASDKKNKLKDAGNNT